MEEAENSRRNFLKWLIGTAALINGLVLGLPFFRALLGPGPENGEERWAGVGDIGSFPEGAAVEIRFPEITRRAYLKETTLSSVWVIKRPSGRFTVFSPVCTHLGCHIQWNPDSSNFGCPCHASVFAADGKVLSGPAPRALDTLDVRIENGTLFVRMQRFRTGIPEKIAV